MYQIFQFSGKTFVIKLQTEQGVNLNSMGSGYEVDIKCFKDLHVKN
jgi:hypothetical protein